MASKALVALAVLKTNSNLGKSYLDNFVPFVGHALTKEASEFAEEATCQKTIRDEFGLNIPVHSLTTIFKILNKTAGLEKERLSKKFRKNMANLKKYDLSSARALAQGEHDALVKGFISYAENSGGQKFDASTAEGILLGYLEEKPFQVLFDRGGTIISENAPRVTRTNMFLFGRFVSEIEKANAKEFEYLQKLAIGNILASALFLEDAKQAGRNFKNTRLYLDAPVLLYALGYSGPERESAEKELLNLLYETGADLRCFRHTYDEMYGILDTLENILRTGSLSSAYGDSIEHFLKKGYNAADVAIFKNTLDEDLRKKLKVTVEPKPDYTEATYPFRIDEDALTKCFEEQLVTQRPLARQRDVDSIAAIPVLRRGHVSVHIEECAALFVTNNSTVARISREALRDKAEKYVIPMAVTTQSLTNLVWLKKPTMFPDLPRKRILADCYAAIQPSDTFLLKCFEEAEKLKASGEIDWTKYFMLRHSDAVRVELMNLTLGEASNLNKTTVGNALSKVIQDIEEPLLARLKEISKDRDKVLAEISDWRERQVEKNKNDEYLDKKAEILAKLVGEWTRKAVWMLAGLAVLLTVFFGFWRILLSEVNVIAKYSILCGAIFVALATAKNLSTNIELFTRRISIHVAMWIEPWAKRLIRAREAFARTA